MYFEPSDYMKSVRLSSRCNIGDVVAFLAEYPDELKWLSENVQFRHIFHMPREPNNQVQDMWMLMVRTVKTESKRECWFVVNGRLVRYSIVEHALLTGLNCKEYPNDWENSGSLNFSRRLFKKPMDKGKGDKGKGKEVKGSRAGVKISDVKNMLVSMKTKKGAVAAADRMRLAVLYFLSKVLVAKNKNDPTVDDFLLRIVDDLSLCEKFPWGRYTFNDCVDSIKTVLFNMKMKGEVKGQPGVFGFIIPPQDIISILEPSNEEKALLRDILEDDEEEGLGYVDPMIDSWTERLLVQKKAIFWSDWYKKDVEACSSKLKQVEGVAAKDNVQTINIDALKALEAAFTKELEQTIAKVVSAVAENSVKLTELEKRVETLEKSANQGPAYTPLPQVPISTPLSQDNADEVECEAEKKDKNKKNKKNKKRKRKEKGGAEDVLPSGAKRVTQGKVPNRYSP